MKNQLLKIYQDRQPEFKDIRERFADEDMAGPLLMSPNNKYGLQKMPLLIVGQETHGWDYHVADLNRQMEVYEAFNVGEEYYASPFWNVTRKVEKTIGNEPHSCAWTNISKFDLDGGRASGEHETAISAFDNMLVDEIKVLKPKVCLFFTGPTFDKRIKNIFTDVELIPVADWGINQLCQLKHKDLPALTFRSYHPNYLRRSGLEPEFIDFLSEVTR